MLTTRRSALVLVATALSGFATSCPLSAQSMEQDEFESMEVSHLDEQNNRVEAAQAAEEIVQATNEFRQQEGYKPVEQNQHLKDAAQYFADYMAENDKYGHGADGNRPSQRATRYGYDYCLISENIAYEYSSLGFTTHELAQALVTGWKNSPGHRKNMLDSDVTDTGVAVAQSSRTGYWYAVQMFGRPQSAAIEFRVANHSNTDATYAIGDRTFRLPPNFTRTHTRCRDVTIDFEVSAPSGDKMTRIRPSDGSGYVIEREGDRLVVQQQ